MPGAEQEARGYLETVERFWLLLRRRGLMISPKDVQLVEEWRRAGVPARIVCAALVEGVERYRRSHGPGEDIPTSLRYFESHVADVARRHASQRAMADSGEPDEEERLARERVTVERLMEELVRIGREEGDSRLKACYREAYRGLESVRRGLSSDAEPTRALDLVAGLMELDRGLVDGLLAKLDDDERTAVETEAARELGPEADRLGERGREERQRAILEDLVTRRYALFRLAPAAPGNEEDPLMQWWRPDDQGEENA